MSHNGYPFWAQVTIGGQTADGYDATNELSYLVIDATTNMQLADPTLSARIHNRTPDKFLMRCGEAITTHGGGLPALFNDEVVIPSQLANVPDMTKEDAYDYCVIGCSEISFGGKGTEGFAYQGLSGGRLLEMMMAGKDPFTGARRTSGAGDMLQWRTADDMMQAFREQVGMFTKFMFAQLLPLVEAHIEHAPCPYLSSVTRDCISRGRSYYGGGAIYGNGVVNVCIVGIGSVGNSIAAIKKLVFDDRVLTMAQLKHALETDFEDTSTTPSGPEIRQLCLAAPKYGNDTPYVDDTTKDCLNIIVKALRPYKTGIGGRYQATISPRTEGGGAALRGLLAGAGHGRQRADGDGEIRGEPRAHQPRSRHDIQHEDAPCRVRDEGGDDEVGEPRQDLLRPRRMGDPVQRRRCRDVEGGPAEPGGVQGSRGSSGGVQCLLRRSGPGGPGRHHQQNRAYRLISCSKRSAQRGEAERRRRPAALPPDGKARRAERAARRSRAKASSGGFAAGRLSWV
jgi:hypothetical protein